MRALLMAVAILVGDGAILVGCGADDSDGFGPSLDGQCATACMTYEQCTMSAPDLTCTNECLATYEHVRPQFVSAFFACYNNQCTKTEEMCGTEAYPAIPRRDIDNAYVPACLTKRNECGNVWGDDLCQSQLYTEAAVADAQACLAKPCAEIKACIELAF